MFRTIAITIALVLLLTSCASKMSIDEKILGSDYSGGFAVNVNTRLSASVRVDDTSPLYSEFDLPAGAKFLEAKGKIEGVKTDKILSIDVVRMPFSNSKLTVSLDPSQVPKEVTVGSDAGIGRALEARTADVDAKVNRRKLRAEAAADEEAADDGGDETDE